MKQLLQAAKQEIFSVRDTTYVILIATFWTHQTCQVLVLETLKQAVWFAAWRNNLGISCKQAFY